MNLSRQQHCDLAGVNVQNLKSLRRLGYLPDRAVNGRSPYSSVETLCLAIACAFVQMNGMSWKRAGEIGFGVMPSLIEQWPELLASKKKFIFCSGDQIGIRDWGDFPAGGFSALKLEFVANVISDRAKKIGIRGFWVFPFGTESTKGGPVFERSADLAKFLDRELA